MKPCQYGHPVTTCGAPAPTKRLRPSATALWDVCERHADVLDRLGNHIEENRPVLDRLRSR